MMAVRVELCRVLKHGLHGTCCEPMLSHYRQLLGEMSIPNQFGSELSAATTWLWRNRRTGMDGYDVALQ